MGQVHIIILHLMLRNNTGLAFHKVDLYQLNPRKSSKASKPTLSSTASVTERRNQYARDVSKQKMEIYYAELMLQMSDCFIVCLPCNKPCSFILVNHVLITMARFSEKEKNTWVLQLAR